MIANMLNGIIFYVQPVTVIAFLITGICLLMLQQWQYGIMNVILACFNFITFYGSKIFK
jgi:hypothetical protein